MAAPSRALSGLVEQRLRTAAQSMGFWNLLALVALFVAAWSLHWFITPEAWRVPAPNARRIATGLQALISGAVAIRAFTRARRTAAGQRQRTE